MSSYQVADAKNNAAGLAVISPQPASPNGIRYADLRFSADGTASFHGYAYIDLVWSSLERSDYNTILTAFGLSQSVAHNAVTVTIRQNDDTFANYNGDAIRVQAERRARAFWRELVIRITHLEAL